MERKEDIFDKIMELPFLQKFQPLYEKYREILLYILFGGLAFFVSIFTFGLFHMWLHMNELVANAVSWVITVLVAFFTNRIWVFESSTGTFAEFIAQMGKFFGGRIITLLIEEGILFAFITCLHFNSMAVKIADQMVVIVLNYVISKIMIFKK